MTDKTTPVVSITAYTDGGCRPNPGDGGYGVHAYTYSNEAPKKGSGNPNYLVTNIGYVHKARAAEYEPHELVKVTGYIDAFGSIPGVITNNMAEITAANWVLEYAKKNEIKNVTIVADSQGVVGAGNGWLDKWSSNHWIKSDGTPVKNQEYWRALYTNINAIKETGGEVTFKWIKAHNGHTGNVEADELATIGVLTKKRGEDNYHSVSHEPPDGYWNKAVDKHPLINHRCLYMSTNPDQLVPGEYYLGNHGKDDELTGTRMADGYHAFVKLFEPDPAIETTRLFQTIVTNGDHEIAMVRLDKLLERRVHSMITKYGNRCLQRGKGRNPDVLFIDETSSRKDSKKPAAEKITPLSKILNPPLLAHRTLERVNLLYAVLSGYMCNDLRYYPTDITNQIYDVGVKKNKAKEDEKTPTLKSDFSAGFVGFDVDVVFSPEGHKCKVNLTLGVDTPPRNSLKKIEHLNPKIVVISWLESDQLLRYATAVFTDTGYGIFSGVFANLRVIAAPTTGPTVA
jgi:ribonuclease HI